MANYDDLTTGQLVETAAHINGWQKIRRLLFGTVRVDALSDGAQLYMKTGTYTGDGAATKAITVETGFQPRMVMIYAQSDGLSSYPVIKTDQDGLNAAYSANYEADIVISLDPNGFTVGDGTGATGGNMCNTNARVYTYIAYR